MLAHHITEEEARAELEDEERECPKLVLALNRTYIIEMLHSVAFPAAHSPPKFTPLPFPSQPEQLA